jgi:lysosomal acid phosphatase
VSILLQATLYRLDIYITTANHASALAFELLRGPPPELREFLRIKFKNGTNEDFQTYPIFGHKGDIAVTEFMYRLEVRFVHFVFGSRSCVFQNFAISSQKQWESACGIHSGYFGITSTSEGTNMLLAVFSIFLLFGVFALSWFKRRQSTHVPIREVVGRFNLRFALFTHGYGL